MQTAPMPTATPSRKLLGAAGVGAALGEIVNRIVDAMPTIDAIIGGPSVEMLIISGATFAVGYMIEEWRT